MLLFKEQFTTDHEMIAMGTFFSWEKHGCAWSVTGQLSLSGSVWTNVIKVLNLHDLMT